MQIGKTAVIPAGTSNAVTTPKNFRSDYIESYNLVLERQMKGTFITQVRYVAHTWSTSYNYGQHV